MTELKNISIKIPLLKEVKNIPIYTKIVSELCIKNPGRWKKDPPTIQVVGKFSSFMSIEITAEKYVDPRNIVLTIFINMTPIANTLIDLGATINIMTLEKLNHLIIHNFLPTPTMFELANRSKRKTYGILKEVILLLDSWEYPTNFYFIQPKTNLGGNPLILGRPCLAIADAFIGCRSRNMTITHGIKTKQITLYPLGQTGS